MSKNEQIESKKQSIVNLLVATFKYDRDRSSDNTRI